MKQKALFLDRDGTLIIDKHYLKDPQQVEPLPSIAHFLSQIQKAGYLLFLFSNQSGISRGYHTLEDTYRCNEKMFSLLNIPQTHFTEICIAPESPEDPPHYRKPSPRFILEMIEKYNLNPQESWMIGDNLSDLQAGVNAKINTLWVATGKPLTPEVQTFINNNNIPSLPTLSFDNFLRISNNSLRPPLVPSEPYEKTNTI